MKLLVGLGNPGSRYRATPHNLGFDVADALSRRHGGRFVIRERERAETTEIRIGAETVLLAKPVTFMNLSGQAVRELMRRRPIGLNDLLVIDDDANLPIGRLRVRARGSHGGHNGLRSIIESVGGEEFARLRIGVQPDRPVIDMARYVLSSPPPVDRARLEEMVDVAADAAECWIAEGTEAAAGRFNGFRQAAAG